MAKRIFCMLRIFVLATVLYMHQGVSPVCGASGRNCGSGGTYFDKHTGRTECCDVICMNARLLGFEEECMKNCPDYGRDAAGAVPANLGETAQIVDSGGTSTNNVPWVPLTAVGITVIVVGLGVFAGGLVFRKSIYKRCRRTANNHMDNGRGDEPNIANDDNDRQIEDPLLENNINVDVPEAGLQAEEIRSAEHSGPPMPAEELDGHPVVTGSTPVQVEDTSDCSITIALN